MVNKCKILNQKEEKVEYEKIFYGPVKEKLKVAKKFQENFEILEKLIS